MFKLDLKIFVVIILATPFYINGRKQFECCNLEGCPVEATHCVIIREQEVCVILEKTEPEAGDCSEVSCEQDTSCVLISRNTYCYSAVPKEEVDHVIWDCPLAVCPENSTHCKVIDLREVCMVATKVRPTTNECTADTCNTVNRQCILIDGEAYCYYELSQVTKENEETREIKHKENVKHKTKKKHKEKWNHKGHPKHYT